MEHTLTMPKERAALERLHRARCIVTTVADGLEEKGNDQATAAAGALAAAVELIVQGMAAFDRPPFKFEEAAPADPTEDPA